MRLLELRLRRLPGIEGSFTLTPEEQVTLVVGPNGSGKSSLTRAFLHLLWPATGGMRPSEISATMDIEGVPWQCDRLNDEPVRWTRDGQPATPPPLPADHLAGCYRLGMLELNRADATADDEALGRAILTQMAGGYDLTGLTQELFTTGAHSGRREREELRKARGSALSVAQKQRALAGERERLTVLDSELDDARNAEGRRRQIERLLEIRHLNSRITTGEAALAALPDGVEQFRPDDPESLRELRGRTEASEERIARLESDRTRRQERLAELALPEGIDGALLIERLEARLEDLRRSHEAVRTAGREAGAAVTGDRPIPRVTGELYHRIEQLYARRTRAEARVEEASANLASLRGGGLWKAIGSIAAALGVVGLSLAAWGSADPAALPGETISTAWLIILSAALLTAGGLALGRTGRARRPSWQSMVVEAERELAEVDSELRQLAQEYGLDLGEANLLFALKAAARAQDRQAESERQQERAAAAQAEWSAELAKFNGELEPLGMPSCDDPAGAAALVARLRERCSESGSVRIEWNRDEDDLALARSQQEKDLARWNALSTRLGLESVDDAENRVALLAAARPDFERISRELEADRSHLQRLADEAADDDHDFQALSDADLAARAQEEALRAGQIEELVSERTRIQSAIHAAQGGSELANAQARVRQAEQQLADLRTVAHEAALGRLLLDRLRQQNEDRSRPAVWNAAVELFEQFTHNEWELRVREADETSHFTAREVDTGVERNLSELSDGTRAQLLLAVRLGFLRVQESGSPLPLFVDDALTAADPRRFRAMASSLAELARTQDRQVIYLTADPADAARFEDELQRRGLPTVHRIDLADIRSLATAVDPAVFTVPDEAAVPAPADDGLSAYARRLRAPGLDPWRSAAAVHLIHLTRDVGEEIEGLYRLVVAGAATVGHWHRARTRLVQQGIVSGDLDVRLARRVDFLHAWLAGWRIGRARPLTREDLEDTEVVSERMLPAVWAEAERVGRDGKLLIESARAGNIKRFVKSKVDRLEIELGERGLMAAADPYDKDALVLHMVQTVAIDGEDSMEVQARFWAHRFLRAAGARPEESTAEGG